MKKTIPPVAVALHPSKPVHVRMLCDDGNGGLVSKLVPQVDLLAHGVTWLAKELGCSKRRARVLLASGRVPGAERDARGAWDLSRVNQVQVLKGQRGPALRRVRVAAPKWGK